MAIETEDGDFVAVEELSLFYFFEPDQVGPWPMLMNYDQWNDTVSLEHLIGILAAYQVHSFLDIYVAQDERNISQFTLQVGRLFRIYILYISFNTNRYAVFGWLLVWSTFSIFFLLLLLLSIRFSLSYGISHINFLCGCIRVDRGCND